MMAVPPSGDQYELSSGGYRAVIVQVGGGIRSCTFGGQDVLQSYPDTAMCDGAHGQPLIPWPNRLADGRYRFDDVDYQVALTEPDPGRGGQVSARRGRSHRRHHRHEQR